MPIAKVTAIPSLSMTGSEDAVASGYHVPMNVFFVLRA